MASSRPVKVSAYSLKVAQVAVKVSAYSLKVAGRED